MANFKNLVLDIETLFQGKDLTDRIKHLTDDLGSMFIKRFLEYAQERQPKLYLSNIGKPICQLWFELNGYKGEPFPPEAKMKFIYGSILESLVVFLAKEAGHEIRDEQRRLEVDGVSGKIDCFIDGMLSDVKSCSSRSFDKIVSGKILEDDPFGYVAQLSGYAKGLGEREAAFVCIDKVTGKIGVFVLTEDMINQYDVHTRIKYAQEAVKGPRPERCFTDQPVSKKDKSGNRVLGTSCSYCAFKHSCWDNLQLRHYAAGPKWFTHIAQEPRLKYEQYEAFPVKEETD